MNWQKRLARGGSAPVGVYLGNMHHTVWLTPRQFEVAAYFDKHRRSTLREAAAHLRQSVTGVFMALRRLELLGVVGRVVRKRGCHGYTQARVQADARRSNVSTTVRTNYHHDEGVQSETETPRSVVETFAVHESLTQALARLGLSLPWLAA